MGATIYIVFFLSNYITYIQQGTQSKHFDKLYYGQRTFHSGLPKGASRGKIRKFELNDFIITFSCKH